MYSIFAFLASFMFISPKPFSCCKFFYSVMCGIKLKKILVEYLCGKWWSSSYLLYFHGSRISGFSENVDIRKIGHIDLFQVFTKQTQQKLPHGTVGELGSLPEVAFTTQYRYLEYHYLCTLKTILKPFVTKRSSKQWNFKYKSLELLC